MSPGGEQWRVVRYCFMVIEGNAMSGHLAHHDTPAPIHACLTGAALLGVLLALVPLGSPSHAAERPLVIRSDRGGLIAERDRQIAQLRASGRKVEVTGQCLSACTMYLSLPQVCLAPGAELGFHGPSHYGSTLPAGEFEYWSRVMASHYREPIHSWFMKTARHETTRYHRLTGSQMIAMGFPACTPDAPA